MPVNFSSLRLASADSRGQPADGDSDVPYFLPGRQQILLWSEAGNLTNDHPDATPAIYVKDLASGAIESIDTDNPDDPLAPLAKEHEQRAAREQDLATETGYPLFDLIRAADAEAVTSPNGELAVFRDVVGNEPAATREGLFLLETASGAVRRVDATTVFDDAPTTQSYVQFDVHFSPDSTKLVHSVQHSFEGEFDYFYETYVIDLATGASTRLLGGDTVFAHHVEFVPGTDQVVYATRYSDRGEDGLWIDGRGGDEDIFVTDLTTGVATRISRTAEGEEAQGWSFQPAVSSDGTSIAYTSTAGNLIEGTAADTRAVYVVTLKATDGDDLLQSLGGETVMGLRGDDTIRGNVGPDDLRGGPGDDRLVGGPGDDRLVGGPGADVFVKRPGESSDKIVDFEPGVDTLDLSGYADDTELTWSVAPNGLRLEIGADRVLLKGVAGDALGAGDYVPPGGVVPPDSTGIEAPPPPSLAPPGGLAWQQWAAVDGGNDHWYALVEAPAVGWTEAEAAAEAVFPGKAHLATVTTAAENAYLEDLMPDEASGWWLGAYQDPAAPDYGEPTGGWRWVTDEPFAFADWRPGEPNDWPTHGNEDKLELASDGGANVGWNDHWDDWDANSVDGYIVEWDPGASPEVDWVQWRTADGGNGHWYALIDAPASSWEEARIAATALAAGNAHLVTTTSADEAAFVADLLPDQRSGWWLGGEQDPTASDYGEPAGGWRWVTGEEFAFTNWAPGEPNDWPTHGNEDKLVARGGAGERKGTWNDLWNDWADNTVDGFIAEWEPAAEPDLLA